MPSQIGEPKAVPAVGDEGDLTTITGAGFYGTKTEEEKKPSFTSVPSRPAYDNRSNANIYPIEGLSPYTHKWTIRARVTTKSDIRRWHKQSGEGKLFSVNFLDESSEIRATGFNEQVDQFYELLQTGQVYYISSPCKVQLAKKQFSNLPNDYELMFESGTVIEKAEDQLSVPQVRFNFCSLGDVANVEKDATIDVVGVLKEVDEVNTILSKNTGKTFDKRDLTLVDDSGFSMRLTVWGAMATAFDTKLESVVAFKGAKVSDFGGRTLSLLSSGTMTVDPDIPDAHRLKGWYDSQGRSDAFSTHSGLAAMGGATGRKDEDRLIADVKELALGVGETAYFSVRATVVYFRQENISYPACPTATCNKKVFQNPDDTWRCEKCDQNFAAPQHRYIMNINVCDHTGQLWVSCFDDVGRLLMGVPADKVVELRSEGGELAASSLFDEANCRKYIFRCRAKMETFQEQER